MVKIEGLDRLLSEHPFFKDFSEAHRELVAGCCANVRFEEGQHLFREGEEADTFYLVRSGRVGLRIYAPGHGAITVQTVGDGEIVGWSWLVPPYRWSSDAVALSLVRAISIDGKCLRAKCENDHELGYQLLKHVMPIIGNRLAATRLQMMDLYGPRKT